MRYFISFLLIILGAFSANCQISTRKVAERVVIPDSIPKYDSLTNTITEKNCKQYIEQQLYMLPNRYQYAEPETYKEMAGRYYNVVNVTEEGSGMYKSIVLHLEDKETKKISKYFFIL